MTPVCVWRREHLYSFHHMGINKVADEGLTNWAIGSDQGILGSKRILVVDDYESTRKVIVEALSQSGRYEISEAADGREALQIIEGNPFDLVISDVMMPGMGGMELLNSIRELNSDTSVIMITAYPAMELTVSAMKKGAVDFLKKPFNIDDLLYKVDIYLRGQTILKGEDHKKGSPPAHLQDKTEELSIQGYIYDAIEDIDGDNEQIFQKIVDLAIKVADGESCSFLLFDEDDNAFHPKIIRSENSEAYRQQTLPLLKQVFKEVAEKREALMVHSDVHQEIAPSLICAPLMIRNNVFGILCVRKKKGGEIFTKKDLHYILSLTKRASLNLENKLLYESVYNNVMDTFRSLVTSIQMRDHYTEEHSQRVTRFANNIAAAMHCPPGDIEALNLAAILHDVGKIAIPDNVLLKLGRLSPEEYLIIKNHPTIGEGIIKTVLLLDNVRIIVRHHHERWDGFGYPDGLSGENIPLLARILTVADSFDAMTNNRPYRSAIGITIAKEELFKCSGLQFDSRIAEAFLDTVAKTTF